jgi:hypothetical protein
MQLKNFVKLRRDDKPARMLKEWRAIARSHFLNDAEHVYYANGEVFVSDVLFRIVYPKGVV